MVWKKSRTKPGGSCVKKWKKIGRLVFVSGGGYLYCLVGESIRNASGGEPGR